MDRARAITNIYPLLPKTFSRASSEALGTSHVLSLALISCHQACCRLLLSDNVCWREVNDMTIDMCFELRPA